MEEVIDKIISELQTIIETDSEDGGISDIISVVDVKFDDPGVVLVDEYPYIFVAPVDDSPANETIGRMGWDVRQLSISVVLCVNAADYFDPLSSQASGSREIVRSMSKIARWLRRLGKRQLDGMDGVRNLVVQSISYVPDMRGDAFVRSAVMAITVERQYQHQE